MLRFESCRRLILIERKYPSGRVVKTTLDADGDLSKVESRKTGATLKTYADNFAYTAAGAVSSMKLGNGNWESTVFNNRLQPIQIALGTSQNATNLLQLGFTYGGNQNNGNVVSQTITSPGFSATQTYNYDSLNRIKDAVEMTGGTTNWKQTFTYDRYGNRNFNASQTTTLGNCAANVCNPSIDPANNRINASGYVYDNAGNLTNDPQLRAFTYDGENKQTKVVQQGATVGEYFYDGDGRRVKKIGTTNNQTETTIFVYDAGGKMVAEYSTNPVPASEAKVNYPTSDHLGSPRINTDANGAVIARHDYLPFGEEISRAGYGADNLRQKFTSYERDIETDLDFAEARYYNNNHGRFTAVDPLMASGDPANPQTFNRYIYVRNNPLILTDPTGLIGDYYDRNGNFLASDGVKDGLVYFADYSYTDTNGDVYGTNVVKTTLEAVQNAQSGGAFSQKSFYTPHQPGDVRDNFRSLIDSTNAALDQKIPVVAGVAATGVAVGSGVGFALYFTGTAAGATFTTLGLNKATATTVGTAAAANPDKTAQVVESVGAAAENVITGFTQHAPNQAITRGFTSPEILNIVRNGTPVDAMGRYGPQVRYTLGNNTVVVNAADKVVTVFSNSPGTRNGFGKGFFIPY